MIKYRCKLGNTCIYTASTKYQVKTRFWITGLHFDFMKSRVQKIKNKFALLNKKKIGKGDSLQAITNFERLKFEHLRVTGWDEIGMKSSIPQKYLNLPRGYGFQLILIISCFVQKTFTSKRFLFSWYWPYTCHVICSKLVYIHYRW